MNISQVVRSALKDRAPKLMAELQSSGTLEEFIQDKASEISSLTTSLAQRIAVNQGLNQAEGQKRAQIMDAAMQSAQEIVLAEQLEFPPEATYQQNQD